MLDQIAKKILIVDDKKEVLELLKFKLSKSINTFNNLIIDTANTFAIATLQINNNYDIIISDYKLSNSDVNKNGIVLLKLFKKENPAIKTILYTSIEDTNLIDINDIDDIEIINKDITFDDLIDYIKIFCIEYYEPFLMKRMFTDIKKIKLEIINQKKDINNLQSISNNVFDMKLIIENFIKNHQHDAYKIVIALIIIIIIIFFIARIAVR